MGRTVLKPVQIGHKDETDERTELKSVLKSVISNKTPEMSGRGSGRAEKFRYAKDHPPIERQVEWLRNAILRCVMTGMCWFGVIIRSPSRSQSDGCEKMAGEREVQTPPL